jgi:phospholipid transport system substrate-binding protein
MALATRQPQEEELRFPMQFKNRRSRMGIAALGVWVAIAIATALPASVSHAADSPRTVVEVTAQQTLEILNSAAGDSEKIKRLQQVAYERIDFETVSRLVLAKYWRQFTPEQRQEFQDEFKRALTLSYSRRIGQFGREKVIIVGERQEPLGDVTVQSRIVGKTADVKADYRLRQKGATWYVIDVVVEGVSIVSSYRTQFQEIIGQGGPQQLLAQLRAKNASGKGLTIPEKAGSGA